MNYLPIIQSVTHKFLGIPKIEILKIMEVEEDSVKAREEAGLI